MLMQSLVTQEDSSLPPILLPSPYNLLTLNNELKISTGCDFQFQPVRNGHTLQMSEWQITSPWKTADRQFRQ